MGLQHQTSYSFTISRTPTPIPTLLILLKSIELPVNLTKHKIHRANNGDSISKKMAS